jgi:hypothetical protein
MVLLVSMAVIALTLIRIPVQTKASGNFDSNNLISDGEFTDINSMSQPEIQQFLVAHGSFLANYSQNGRSASQIIYDAAHGYGDASGSLNGITINTTTGTVSPKVILVTLQKENSLISMTTQNDSSLNSAMGYACPDSGGCNSAYAGFTKQVENASWQLRYNYDRASGTGFSDYQVGQTQIFSDYNGDHTVTFANRATSALYRYTPHVYNGNYNFWNLFNNTYNFDANYYSADLTNQSNYITIFPGQSTNLSVGFENNGGATWNSSVRLAIERGWESGSRFAGPGWLSTYRVAAVGSVASGDTANFNIPITIPANTAPGQYRFQVRMVADGITWFDGDQAGAWWYINVPKPTADYVSQSNNPTLSRGDNASLTVTFRNTSGATWPTVGQSRVNLAIDKDWSDKTAWQGSGWMSENRIVQASEGAVAPGGLATYTFNIHVPTDMPSGQHRFYVRLVSENNAWFDNPDINGAAWWEFTVR